MSRPWRRAGQQPREGELTGVVRVDARTKRLVKRLRAGEIAVIDHEDLDRVGAETLVACRPAAVVNAGRSVSGRYPTAGPAILVEAGVPLLDAAGPEVMLLRDGDRLRIDDQGVCRSGEREVARGEWLAEEEIRKRIEAAKDNLAAALEDFTANTLSFVRQERDLLLEGQAIPTLRTPMRDQQVLVVVRGHDYRQDLETLRGYVREYRPVLIGVDGGADALLEAGFKPDIIVGDMDSVSSQALGCGAEVVVHAYADGRAPGLERVQDLGIEPVVFPGGGLSQDMAMLLAYEAGCDLIVAVGAQSSLVELLDKGRKGMASTFLVRLKVGNKLVDARGVNRLYRQGVRRGDLAMLVLAALVAMLVFSLVSEPLRLFWKDLFYLGKDVLYRITSLF
ncbi:MAG TPA: putative cytokinetic ring protein SteA [Actinomycetes bacterium]|nr:putative cytokinetic ring protein SteA [Actinomycetes bacterium]